ncbi:hypothetical protein D3C78_1065900 [compost metagenome]
MPVVVVIGEPRLELAMQGQQVQHVLQVIAVVENRLLHGRHGVGRIIGAKPVGFVVGNVIAAVVFERQVDEALEHAVEQHRFGGHPGHAVMGVLAHQRIELEYIDLMAGEPEFHLDLVLRQLREYHRRLIGTQLQRRLEQMLQPVAQRGDPALPASAIAATGNGVGHLLGCRGKPLAPRPFEQTMEEGAGVRAARESMDIAAAGHHFPGSLRVETFVIEQFLRLRTLRRLVRADTQGVANAQCAVRGDPPVFTGLAFRDQRSQQRRVVLRWQVMLCCRVRHLGIGQRRAVLLQVAQPLLQRRGVGQWCTATQQITQGRQMQHRTIVVTALEVSHPQPAGVLRPGQGDIEQA